jgi:hypothetical protein
LPCPSRNLLWKIKESIRSGNYIIRKHALERLNEREISLKDALYALSHGYHEKQKTSFDTVFQTWKYSIRGKTTDGLSVRVIVAFVEKMAIITVIKLQKR